VLIALVWSSLNLDSLVLKLALAPVLGLAGARLFALGHDACHGSLCATSLVNQVAGWLLFLPTLTPFSLWDAGQYDASWLY
jgi:omega-6 fatty acid desaturase (delta-12 desaturase)